MNRFYIAIIVSLLLGMVACQEADKVMFTTDTSGIYFKLGALKKDSALILRQDTIAYTFVYDPEEVGKREICIPVELVGNAVDRDRKYSIEIQAAGNTVEGTDYEPVKTEQVFCSGKTIDSLRIVWKRNLSMQKEVKKLNIRIVGGGDFTEGVEEKLFVALQASDIFEKPDWWDGWEIGFGAWHPTKLREWIKIWGRESLPVKPWMPGFSNYPQECTAIVKLHDLFERKEFYDENENRLYVPANFN